MKQKMGARGKNGEKERGYRRIRQPKFYILGKGAGLLHLRHDFSGKILRLFLNPFTKLKAHIL